METPELSLAVVSNSQQSPTRSELFHKLARVEEERSKLLRQLGLADANIMAVPGDVVIDQQLVSDIEALTLRIAKMEAKVFADGIVATNGHTAKPRQVSHEEPEVDSDNQSDDAVIARKARELGCPAEWLSFRESSAGLRFVCLRHGKAAELKKLKKKEAKEAKNGAPEQAPSDDEVGREALKLDDKPFLAWCRSTGKNLIVGKDSQLSQALKDKISQRVMALTKK